MPPSFPLRNHAVVLRIPGITPLPFPLRGYHPLRRRIPADFGYGRKGRPGSYNSTSPIAHRYRVRFALCRFRSPLLPASLLISFPGGTEMLHFPPFPLGHKARVLGILNP